MSDEPEENYESGNIVWVKLGATWWPGEVKKLEELPNEVIEFKKPPLAIVKFFDEDSYEYVRTWMNIFPYSCDKKNEFIKKGMAAFRAKVPHMDKFPTDVLIAEERIGGNPNILSDPMFLPEKKRNYAAEVFGTPSPKSGTPKNKKRPSNKSGSKKDTSHITHRRFLGVDDYRAYICIQYPGKDRTPGDKEDEEVLRINRESEQDFNCHSCSFSTKRLEVMILHTKSHIQGCYLPSYSKNKQTVRRRKEKTKKTKGSDVVDSGTSSESEPVRQKKRKAKPQVAKKPKVKKVGEDIRKELLEAWADTEEEEELESFNTAKESSQDSELAPILDESQKPCGDTIDVSSDQDDTAPTKTITEPVPSPTIEEALNDVSGGAEELNVQPEAKEQLSTENLLSTLEGDSDEKTSGKIDVSETTRNHITAENSPAAKKSDVQLEVPKRKMDDDIHEAIKSCFDFDEDDDEEDSTIVNKTSTGRKIPRVIPKTSRKDSMEIEPEETEPAKEPAEDIDTAFNELMEMTAVPDLPDVQNSLKCEQNFHDAKTIKFPDKPERVESPPKKDATEVATKLTNPKKRFVKSFEDFELMQNEIRRREEEQSHVDLDGGSSVSRSEYSEPESTIELSKLKSKIMSKIIEEAKINNESKNKIMSKIQEVKPKTSGLDSAKLVESESSREKAKVETSHRTPRSKILESYRKEHDVKEKVVEAPVQKEKTVDKVDGNKNVTPPKKNKWSRRGSHPKKDKKLFLLQNAPSGSGEAHKEKEVVSPKIQTPLPPEVVEPEHKPVLVDEVKEAESAPHVEVEESCPDKDIIKERLGIRKKIKTLTEPADIEQIPREQQHEILLDIIGGNICSNRATSEFIEKETVVEEVSADKSEAPHAEVETPHLKDESLHTNDAPHAEDEASHVENEAVQVEDEPAQAQDEPPQVQDKPLHVEDEPLHVEVESLSLEDKAPLLKDETSLAAGEAAPAQDEARPVEDQALPVDQALLVEDQALRLEDQALLVEDEAPPALDKALVAEHETPPVEELVPSAEEPLGKQEEKILEKQQSVPVEKPEEPESLVSEQQLEKACEEKQAEETVESPPINVPSVCPEEKDVPILSDVVEAASIDTTCEELLVVDEQQVIEESLVLSPVAESVPSDAVISPRSRKRTISEVEMRTDDLAPSEKKKKDSEVVEEGMQSPAATETIKAHDVDTANSTECVQEFEANKESVESDKQIEDVKLDSRGTEDIEMIENEAVEEKPESSKELEQEEPSEHNNEVEIQCASSSLDSFKFSIQTNLSILSSKEEMSALALATLSEIKADLESSENDASTEEEPKREPTPPMLIEPEMVPIERNLTVMSEKDLVDRQFEITAEKVISPKRPVTLSNFSLDFSDSMSDSNSNSANSVTEFNSKGTEFTSTALTKHVKKFDQKKENTYGRLELLNILEGNSDSEKKSKSTTQPIKKSNIVDDICDFEEHIPSQIVCAKSLKRDEAIEELQREMKEPEKPSKTSVKSTTSKLLERLTTESKAKATRLSDIPSSETVTKPMIKGSTITLSQKNIRYVMRSKPAASTKSSIPSEQIVKPVAETSKSKPKKLMEDIEDVEAFVIHKDPKKIHVEEDKSGKQVSAKTTGKAKILQQTIITAAGEIIQPNVVEAQTDDNIFDINSMPIVLSDEILTPESIEKMPIVIGTETKTPAPAPTPTPTPTPTPEKPKTRPVPTRIITTPPVTTNKTVAITKHKPPRILQTSANRVVKNSPLLPNTAKPGKYIIVPQSSIPQTKYVAKKPTIVKKNVVPTGLVQNIAPESSGNKIMIVTNQQGQQQRLLLTPAQQKMLGYQNQKVTKTIVKSNVTQKSVLGSTKLEAGTSGIPHKTASIIGQKVVVGTSGNQAQITSSQVLSAHQGRITKTVTKRLSTVNQKVVQNAGRPQKTILIKNQHGQTVRKIQGTDDELLDKQVAEQLEAIKASSGMKFGAAHKPVEIGAKSAPRTTVRRSYSKRVEPKLRAPPPLTGIQSSKPETVVATPKTPAKNDPPQTVVEEPKQTQTERPLNQLVIQDAVGNQTTITEGQILALPSETLDGQPQSYVLVTLDESGNLTPLNNEALMSLDPNLGLGGDLSNMVLQIDQGTGLQIAAIKPPEPAKPVEVEPVPEPVVTTEQKVEPEPEPEPETIQSVAPSSTNGDPGQQLIVTGDPIATQKFLESLTEGTTDLANILANAEGNSILIQADGQQILINTNTDNQVLLSMNNDNVNVTENTEGGGNPIFSTQPSKNQDILAAALADTDVFQQEHPSSAQSKIGSQLSPTNSLYPMNVGNVLETSLTLSSPIMTPLEVPSTNNKKIPDEEADILTQVPKNVDLPITITDPNISQTVANQQLIANELQSNLELALPISETNISSVVSTELNSPSYVYSLPSLDDSVEMAQKPFNGSMPLLTEDVEEAKTAAEPKASKREARLSTEEFLAEDEGRFTLGGEMCSSLSEPPPEMFDLPEVSQSYDKSNVHVHIPSLESTPDVSDNASKDEDTTDLSTHADTSSEGSCEIPVQPQIVAKSLDLSRNLDSLKRSLDQMEDEDDEGNKKCKFD